MTGSRRNTVLLVLLALLLVGGIVVVVLPQIILHRLSDRLAQTTGLILSLDTKSRLTVADGLAITLSDVALASRNQQGVPVIAAAEVTVPLHVSDFLPGADGPSALTLEGASFVFPVTAEKAGKPAAQPRPLRLTLRNSTFKLDDPKRGTVFAASDINGEVVVDKAGALLIDVRALLNGLPTQVTASFDDVLRLQENGSPADIALATTKQSLTLSGRARARPLPAFDGTFMLQSPDATLALQWLGFGVFPVLNGSALSLDGPASVQGLRVELPKSVFVLGGSKGEMTLAFDADRDRPKLLARSVVDELVLTGPAILSPSGNWSDVPFDVSSFRNFDADVAVTTTSARIAAVTMGPSRLTAKLDSGTAELKLNGEDLSGGTLAARLAMTITESEPALRLDLSLTNAKAERLLPQLLNASHLKGDGDVVLKLEVTGRSPARIISSLKGDATIQLRNGSLAGYDLASQAETAETTSREGWQHDATSATILNDAILEAKLDEGIARIVKGEINGATSLLSFSGEIDLLRQALLLKLESGVAVSGPWANPQFSPPP